MKRPRSFGRALFQILVPDDIAARDLAARSEAYDREPPPEEWTGAVHLKRKK